MLKGIIERMLNGTGEINFKESFQSLSKSSELTSLVKTLPESVSRSEGLNTLWESIARLAISHESQKDCLIAIDAFVKKFPDSAHE